MITFLSWSVEDHLSWSCPDTTCYWFADRDPFSSWNSLIWINHTYIFTCCISHKFLPDKNEPKWKCGIPKKHLLVRVKCENSGIHSNFSFCNEHMGHAVLCSLESFICDLAHTAPGPLFELAPSLQVWTLVSWWFSASVIFFFLFSHLCFLCQEKNKTTTTTNPHGVNVILMKVLAANSRWAAPHARCTAYTSELFNASAAPGVVIFLHIVHGIQAKKKKNTKQ